MNEIKYHYPIPEIFHGDLTEPGKGILFALPLSFVEGLSD
jgi:hypothetical protein